MSYATQARPYANAAFDVASSSNSVDAWWLGLCALNEALSNKRLQGHINNPTVTLDSKIELLGSLCSEWMSDEIKRFVQLLGENGRLLAIADICAIFEQRRDEAAKAVPAAFTTAIELDEARQNNLVEAVSKKTGLNLVSTFLVDPEIIGGVIVRFNGNVIDVSVRNQLAQLQSNLIR